MKARRRGDSFKSRGAFARVDRASGEITFSPNVADTDVARTKALHEAVRKHYEAKDRRYLAGLPPLPSRFQPTAPYRATGLALTEAERREVSERFNKRWAQYLARTTKKMRRSERDKMPEQFWEECLKRKQRREVLFAERRTAVGAGGKKHFNYFSKFEC